MWAVGWAYHRRELLRDSSFMDFVNGFMYSSLLVIVCVQASMAVIFSTGMSEKFKGFTAALGRAVEDDAIMTPAQVSNKAALICLIDFS